MRSVTLLACVLLTAACGHEFDPPDRAARVEEAQARYSSELFDTLEWESDETRSAEGNLVYADECRRCHGALGRGETDYARARNLTVPSLVQPEWRYAGSLDEVRRLVYAGHGEGMPGFGVAGITLREVDAAAFYVLYTLRPDVLGAGAR